MASMTLEALNRDGRDNFVAILGDVFEHASWVAEHAFAAHPFATVVALHEAMMQAVRSAPREQQLALLRGHPELGGKVARAGAITAASRAEQSELGLDRLSHEEFARFERLSARYAERFGFPFIICARLNNKAAIKAAMLLRLSNPPDVEFQAALGEIEKIAQLRLEDLLKS